MFERFTGQARQALGLACREALRCHHDYLGTEHILFGLVKEGSPGVLRVLEACRVEPSRLLQEIEEHWPDSPSGVVFDKLPFTRHAKRALAAADLEANRLQQTFVAPVHLLLGILDDDSVAAVILKHAGVDQATVREEMRRLGAGENRDSMVRSEARPGTPVASDPSVRDLESLVSVEPLPGSPPGTELASGTENNLALIDMDRQLRGTQTVLSALGGGVLGALLSGLPGALPGCLAGLVVAGFRNSLVSGLVAAAGGFFAGYGDRFGGLANGFLGALLGFFVGTWVGDGWRKKLADRARQDQKGL
jgi:hypothetical protein